MSLFVLSTLSIASIVSLLICDLHNMLGFFLRSKPAFELLVASIHLLGFLIK